MQARYVVLTLDQRGSRSGEDAVPALLEALARPPLPGRPTLEFQRTVGDEVQGVVRDPATCVEVVGRALRRRLWSVGLGIGSVETPLPAETRAGRGPAFVHARDAVTRAKSAPHHLAVVADESVGGPGESWVRHLETTLGLWAGILERRSARGWEVHDLLAAGLSHSEAGTRLGISQSAVSQRAAAAGLTDESRARALAVDLCAVLLGADGVPGRDETRDEGAG